VYGKVPQAPDYPQAWHDTPRQQAFTIADFTAFCRENSVEVRQETYLSGERHVTQWSNLLARTAVFALERQI
ncbi:MAG TPA: methionine biosynthesis protein MetW, partial [Promineifilum sp.]|nr:methionine biosynthesis protein MetW [Promineifilum sp.]